MNVLLSIDDFLSNIVAQTILFALCIVGLYHLHWWIVLGFLVHIALWIVQYKKDKNYFKDIYKEAKLIGLLKGFNYCLLSGPLAIILYFLINQDQKDNDNN